MKGQFGMSGKLKVKKIKPRKEGITTMLINKIKPYAQKFGLMLPKKDVVEMYGSLAIKKIDSEGGIEDYGIVSRQKITDGFVENIVTHMQTTAGEALFKWHGSGVTTGVESTGDTSLGAGSTAYGLDAGTSSGTVNVYTTIATHTYAAAAAITEHGVFNSSGLGGAGGTLMDRSLFAAVNCSSGDSIQFTYQLTCNAGG